MKKVIKENKEQEIYNNKTYKVLYTNDISSLRTVTIFPGDRKVAGCLYFLGGNIYGKLYSSC
jgi:hypothetical protein